MMNKPKYRVGDRVYITQPTNSTSQPVLFGISHGEIIAPASPDTKGNPGYYIRLDGTRFASRYYEPELSKLQPTFHTHLDIDIQETVKRLSDLASAILLFSHRLSTAHLPEIQEEEPREDEEEK